MHNEDERSTFAMDLKHESLKWAMQLDQIEARFQHMFFQDDEKPFVDMWLALQKETLRFVQLALRADAFQDTYLNLYAAYAQEANKMADVVLVILATRRIQ